jgi:hypothetical protein
MTRNRLFAVLSRHVRRSGGYRGHLSLLKDKGHMIANLEPSAGCQGHWIKAVIESNGKYTVTNGRNGFSQSYQVK